MYFNNVRLIFSPIVKEPYLRTILQKKKKPYLRTRD